MRKRVQLTCNDKSRTKQNFKDLCDINLVVKRWLKSGQMPQADMSGLQYGDFTGDSDFMSLSNKLIRAEQSFMSLPAQTRKRFDNDPAQLLSFIADRSNFDEAVKLGLVDKPVNAAMSAETAVLGSEQSFT